MKQEDYDAHVAALQRGEIVTLGGRIAFDEDELRRVIHYNGDALPGEEAAPAPATVTKAEMDAAIGAQQSVIEALRADNHALQSRVDALTADKKDLETRNESLKADRAAQLAADEADANQKAADNTVRAAAKGNLPIVATDAGQSKPDEERTGTEPVDGVLPAGKDKIVGPVAGSLTQTS